MLGGPRGLPRFVLELLAVILVVVALLLPRLASLGSFVTADEPTWGKRSASFYYALKHGEYEATYQTGHPGVTTMWAGAAAYALQFPRYEKVGQLALGDTKLLQIFERQGPTPIALMATARLMVVLVVTGALLLAYLFARRLFGLPLALLGFLLIAFDPFPVAHARFLHTNGMLATFMFLSLLAFMDFLVSRKGWALAVSAAAAGLAFVCISPGFMLVPAVGLIALLHFWLDRRDNDLAVWDWKLLARQVVLPLAAWGALSLLVVYAVWPAMWREPVETLTRMLSYGMSAAEGEIGGVHLVAAYQDAEKGSQFLYFYPLTYLWRSTPVSLIGALLAAGFLAFGGVRLESNTRRRMGWLLLFVAVYTVLMSLGSKKFDRYFLPAYLPLDLAAALGWIAALGWLGARFSRLKGSLFPTLVLALLVGVQAFSAFQNAPYYLTYYNPLLGGLRRAPQVMTVGWGEGLNEAALWLRDQPGGCGQRILSWYPLAYSWYSISFKCAAELVEFSPQMSLQDYLGYDYAVIYINQRQRSYPSELLAYLDTQVPAHSVWIKGVEYVQVYRLPGGSE